MMIGGDIMTTNFDYITNYDHILKHLTPTKLKDMLVDRYDCCDYCVGNGLPEECESEGLHCTDGIMAWLKKEYTK